MKDFEIGCVVVSAKGKDKGRLMLVVGKSGKYLLVCDGKKRKIASPKRKNPCHLSFLPSEDVRLPVNAELTDGRLRRELDRIRRSVNTESDLSDE